MFCDKSAHDIIGMLEHECRAASIEIRTRSTIREVHKTDAFVVRTDSDVMHAPCLVVATGGLSVPKIGATSFGYDLARQFGLMIQPPRPGLVPFVFSESDNKRWCDLAGVSTEAVASVPSSKQTFREKMLFTHRGISGPAVLQISSYWNGQEPVSLDQAPERDLVSELRARWHRDGTGWKSLLRDVVPRRLADRWLEVRPLIGNSDSALVDAERQLHEWKIVPAGTEGFGKAEVTAGGVDTDELSAKTMESRRVPGLFLIGEVVDVTGQLGGFNFQWAWASGFCAGQVL